MADYQLDIVQLKTSQKVANVPLLHFSYVLRVLEWIELQNSYRRLALRKIGFYVAMRAAIDEDLHQIHTNLPLPVLKNINRIVDASLSQDKIHDLSKWHLSVKIELVYQRKDPIFIDSISFQKHVDQIQRLLCVVIKLRDKVLFDELSHNGDILSSDMVIDLIDEAKQYLYIGLYHLGFSLKLAEMYPKTTEGSYY